MNITGYLVFKKLHGYKGGTVRFCKNKPHLDSSEVPMKVTFDIPDLLFSRPVLEAKVTIPNLNKDIFNIEPEVCSDIEQLMRERTGLDIKILLPETTENK